MGGEGIHIREDDGFEGTSRQHCGLKLSVDRTDKAVMDKREGGKGQMR